MGRLILIIGFAVILGSFGGRIFAKFRIPQVVGYIVIGVIAIVVGGLWLHAITTKDIEKLEPISLFALAIIGFSIGGELKKEVFKKYGKGLIILLLCEGISAAILVTLFTGLITCPWHELQSNGIDYILMNGNWPLAILLGAIASATAPAATVDVLWEYKTLGVLTTTVMAIVALDDGLALLLFGFASSLVDLMTDKGSLSLLSAVGKPLYDIFGSITLGALAGSAIASILRFFFNREIILPLCVGCLLAIIGICDFLDLDLILAAMSSGAIVANLVPRQSNEAFDQLSKFAPPIFVLFFVLVGARLQLKAMEAWIIALAVAYLIGRTGGKFLGAYLGAKWGRMPTKVKKYLGFCLFSQAGVAVGLAILAGHKLPQETAQSIILVITSTTFLVQIIGPPSVRFAVFKAGEVGKDVTEEDLLASHHVREFMDSNPAAFKNDAYLKQILQEASKSDALFYPVVDEKNQLSGVISFLKIKNLFTEEGLEDLVVAEDLMEKVDSVIVPEAKLAEALSIMRKEELEYLPVVSNLKSQLFIGMIEERKIRKTLHQEIIQKKNSVKKKV